MRERHIRESALDEVPGIGEAKKAKLLRRFKSIYGIARADEDEIAAVACVGRAVAEAVSRAAKTAAGEKGLS